MTTAEGEKAATQTRELEKRIRKSIMSCVNAFLQLQSSVGAAFHERFVKTRVKVDLEKMLVPSCERALANAR